MRAVIQRVSSNAYVRVKDRKTGEIDKGLVVLLGIEESDGPDDIEWLARKIVSMRIFSDDEGKMNLSVMDIGGELLVISQFTLHASTRKGNRPSFVRAGSPKMAERMYHNFMDHIRKEYRLTVASGEFAAHMEVSLTNDGPVTIIIDSKTRE